MENLWIFLATTTIYSSVVMLLMGLAQTKYPIKKLLPAVVYVTALLCIPFNVGGNIYTLCGNAKSENGVYSLFSLYQRGDAVFTALSIGGVQLAEHNAGTLLGIVSYQKSNRSRCNVLAGVVAYQKSHELSALFMGLVGYQESDRAAHTFVGIALVQKVKDKQRTFATINTLE